MRILLVNNNYFPEFGGPTRYMFRVAELFEQHGHTVIPLSNSYARNKPSPYAHYFLPSPVDEDAVYFREYKLTLRNKMELVGRATYSLKARSRIEEMIQKEKIDVVYLLNIANYISPSVIDGCHRMHVPVVMRLSDFYLLCPNYIFFRNGQVCEECAQQGLHRALIHRCLKGSLSVTTARVIAMTYHQLTGVNKMVDAFISPSKFLMEKLIHYGYPAEKFVHIPTIVEHQAVETIDCDRKYFLYMGRISPEKGLETLVRAFNLLLKSAPEARLVIAGEITDEARRLQQIIQQEQIDHIEFPGYIDKQHFAEVMSGAIATICASICYDNTPNSVYESLAFKRPVIVTKIGSLPEQIRHGIDGLHCEVGSENDLAAQLLRFWEDPELARKTGEAGHDQLTEEYSPQKHYEQLMAVFSRLKS